MALDKYTMDNLTEPGALQLLKGARAFDTLLRGAQEMTGVSLSAVDREALALELSKVLIMRSAYSLEATDTIAATANFRLHRAR